MLSIKYDAFGLLIMVCLSSKYIQTDLCTLIDTHAHVSLPDVHLCPFAFDQAAED